MFQIGLLLWAREAWWACVSEVRKKRRESEERDTETPWLLNNCAVKKIANVMAATCTICTCVLGLGEVHHFTYVKHIWDICIVSMADSLPPNASNVQQKLRLRAKLCVNLLFTPLTSAKWFRKSIKASFEVSLINEVDSGTTVHSLPSVVIRG